VRTPTVDREQELARFSELLRLAGQGESRVLVIEDASGHGKSRLVQRFRKVCQECSTAWSFVDLVAGSLTPLDILNRITSDLGTIVRFEHYRNVVDKKGALSVPVTIAENKTVGKLTNTVEVTVNASSSPEEQKQIWGEAAECFKRDLSVYRSMVGDRAIVLLFDTFETAAPEAKVWIADHLLPAVGANRVAGLLIVLAGKTCPKPSGEWETECEPIILRPLEEKHWIEYAKEVGVNLTQEQIRMVYHRHEALALRIAETLSIFVGPVDYD
jgi:hypothetical protein